MAKAKKAKKKKLEDLPGLDDPRAPLDGEVLLKEAQAAAKALRKDLGARAKGSASVTEALKARHAAEKKAKRTAAAFGAWQERFIAQVAAAWVLSCVFVRVLEDRGLLGRNRIAGDGAGDSRAQFFQMAPSLTERDYLLLVFRELSRFPAARDLFDAKHNPVWLLGPSKDGWEALLRMFRTPSIDAPALRFGQADTRFVGDLYQDLDEDVRKRFALLQTPRFVESFILDRTLEPAIEKFGLDDTTVIDPTCGSGHFLLGSFERLFEHRLRAEPGLGEREAARKALDAVFGADINAYAVAISRFRLTLAFLEKAGVRKVSDAPELPMHLVVADSLLHNPHAQQGHLADQDGARKADWEGQEFALEDESAARNVLYRSYSAVVGNPPFSTPGDAAVKEVYRKMYRSASGKFTLSAPFVERFFHLSVSGGCVGLINSIYFSLKAFGRPLIEEVLPRYSLTHVINTSGVGFPSPGFKTSTGVIFGRNVEALNRETVVVKQLGKDEALSKAGEATPAWQAIEEAVSAVPAKNQYVSAEVVRTTTLHAWPWGLVSGPGEELVVALEKSASSTLGEFMTKNKVGVLGMSNADEVFRRPKHRFEAASCSEWARPHLVGQDVRDYMAVPSSRIFWPYDGSLELMFPSAEAYKMLWPHIPLLATRATFSKKTYSEEARSPFEWHQVTASRVTARVKVLYPEIAAEPAFVIADDRALASQSIMSFESSLEGDSLESLVAYLNSSLVGLFLLRRFGRSERVGYRLPGKLCVRLPVLPGVVESGMTSQRLARLGREAREVSLGTTLLRSTMKEALVSGGDPRTALASYRGGLQQSIESLDLIQTSLDRTVLWLLARASGSEFALPAEWTARRWEALRKSCALLHDARVGGRIFSYAEEQLEANQDVASSEVVREVVLEQVVGEALEEFVSVEELWGRFAEKMPALANLVGTELFAELVSGISYPCCAAVALTDEGMQKLKGFERAWNLLRAEPDRVWRMDERPLVFERSDFRRSRFWDIRGKAYSETEGLIEWSLPEGGRPLYGAAAWDHLQRAKALGTLYMNRKCEEQWDGERLTPMLVGLLELLPWLQQWHPEHADYFQGFVDGQSAELGLTREDLSSWRPSRVKPRNKKTPRTSRIEVPQ